MDNLRNAAIILLGMGEHCASEILKNLSHKEVESIIETMNNMDEVSEHEVIKALNEFFDETNTTTGINVTSNEYIRKTLLSAVGQDKAGTIFDETYMAEELKGCELLKWQPVYSIVDALEDEHPQIITVALMCLDSEKSAQILQLLPQELSNNVINRITNLSPVSSYAMKTLSDYLEEQFTQPEKFKLITSDGVNIAANIIANMNGDSENEVMSYLTTENKAVYDKIQDRLFPFERLAKFDSKSMQTLIAEIGNDELILALNGATAPLKQMFFKNMSAKSVDLLKEDLETAGPVKLQEAIDAQKRIVALAKKLINEQKIYMSSGK